MSEVIEQGATRWVRPGDFGGGGGKHYDNRVPSKDRRNQRPTRSPKRGLTDKKGRPRPGHPDYRPRNPRSPKVWPGGLPPYPGGAPRRAPDGTPLPYNPRKPSVSVPRFKPVPGLGRAIPLRRLPRLPGAGQALGLLDTLDELYKRKLEVPYPNPSNGWFKTFECETTPPPNTWGSPTHGIVPVIKEHHKCIGGQAQGQPGNPQAAPTATSKDWSAWWSYPITGGFRSMHRESWKRYTVATNVLPLLITTKTAPFPSPVNPNTMRMSPSLPAPEPVPVPEPAMQPAGLGAPITRARVIDPKAGVRPIRARKRMPPRSREDEGKTFSGSKRIMTGFFKALDVTSEASEVIDAIYGGLPPETKKKWGCNRSNFGIDQAGQYGIDNADCKAKALFHNWHKVDWSIAVENVIKNALEDKVLGAIHRGLPRNTGSALDPSFQELGEHLQAALDELVQFK